MKTGICEQDREFFNLELIISLSPVIDFAAIVMLVPSAKKTFSEWPF